MDNLDIAENGKGDEASPYMYESAEEKDNKGIVMYLEQFTVCKITSQPFVLTDL